MNQPAELAIAPNSTDDKWTKPGNSKPSDMNISFQGINWFIMEPTRVEQQ